MTEQQFCFIPSLRWEQDGAFSRLCPVVSFILYAGGCCCLRSAFCALIGFVRHSSGGSCCPALIGFSNSNHGTKAAQRHHPAPNSLIHLEDMRPVITILTSPLLLFS
ncbi:hypothetical protein [Flavitalea sp.]|nr:hypothetical protein [Flavitalea sp.]